MPADHTTARPVPTYADRMAAAITLADVDQATAERDRYAAALAEIGRRAVAADAGDADTLRTALRAIAAQANTTGHAAAADRPRIVALCGSTKFRDDFHRTSEALTLAGRIVVMPGVFSHTTGTPITDDQKATLAALHFRKIDMADEVYVVDPGGYVGESTSREIAYAEQAGKPIRRLSVENALTCAEPDCPTPVPDKPGNRCDFRPHAGCEQLFCDNHLYAAGSGDNGQLCGGCYDDVNHGDLNDHDQQTAGSRP